MNGRQLTDAQISKALRVHLPERAYPGLRERILEAAEATTQQRALPSVIGALSKADPMTRRRTLLIAAALLVAAVLASAAAVGALRLLQRDPVQDLSLEARPSLPGVVTPSSTPSLPSAGPTPSAVTSPTGVWIATVLANGKVLVTGYDGAQLYDPDTGTWSATGKMVTPRYNHTATLLPDGGVLVAGGDVPPDLATDSAELYDPVTGSWTVTANLRATGNPRLDSITATLPQDGTVLAVRPSTAAAFDPA